MAEINQGGGGGKHKGGKVRGKKMSTKVDFTPMVDLGFLLITFFMLTTTMSKPQTMQLTMPEKDIKDQDSTKVKESTAMTIILSENNRIYYYFGIQDPKVEVTNFGKDGIRKILIEKNRPQLDKINALKDKLKAHTITEAQYKSEAVVVHGDKNALMVLIKSDEKAKYKNLVDILDEMNICSVGKYALLDITPPEIEMVKNVQVTK